MKPGTRHVRCLCGALTTTTLDALQRPRQRRALCEGVSVDLDARRAPLPPYLDLTEYSPPAWSARPVHNLGDRD